MVEFICFLQYNISRKQQNAKENGMEKKIKVGLIGAGQMAEYHVRGFLEGGAEVVAVADMNAEKGKAFAAKWGFPGEVYENLSVMAAKDWLQSVHCRYGASSD